MHCPSPVSAHAPFWVVSTSFPSKNLVSVFRASPNSASPALDASHCSLVSHTVDSVKTSASAPLPASAFRTVPNRNPPAPRLSEMDAEASYKNAASLPGSTT